MKCDCRLIRIVHSPCGLESSHQKTMWIDSLADYQINRRTGCVTGDYTNVGALQDHHGTQSQLLATKAQAHLCTSLQCSARQATARQLTEATVIDAGA
ncbi:hypothetical protein D9M71_769560 [compost metagenome]